MTYIWICLITKILLNIFLGLKRESKAGWELDSFRWLDSWGLFYFCRLNTLEVTGKAQVSDAARSDPGFVNDIKVFTYARDLGFVNPNRNLFWLLITNFIRKRLRIKSPQKREDKQRSQKWRQNHTTSETCSPGLLPARKTKALSLVEVKDELILVLWDKRWVRF